MQLILRIRHSTKLVASLDPHNQRITRDSYAAACSLVSFLLRLWVSAHISTPTQSSLSMWSLAPRALPWPRPWHIDCPDACSQRSLERKRNWRTRGCNCGFATYTSASHASPVDVGVWRRIRPRWYYSSVTVQETSCIVKRIVLKPVWSNDCDVLLISHDIMLMYYISVFLACISHYTVLLAVVIVDKIDSFTFVFSLSLWAH